MKYVKSIVSGINYTLSTLVNEQLWFFPIKVESIFLKKKLTSFIVEKANKFDSRNNVYVYSIMCVVSVLKIRHVAADSIQKKCSSHSSTCLRATKTEHCITS